MTEQERWDAYYSQALKHELKRTDGHPRDAREWADQALAFRRKIDEEEAVPTATFFNLRRTYETKPLLTAWAQPGGSTTKQNPP